MQFKAYGQWHPRAKGGGRGWLTKTLFLMRLTGIILLAGVLQVAARGTAQTVTYTGTGVPLTRVFAEIKKQTGFVFFYNAALLDDQCKVTVHFDHEPLNSALRVLLAGQSVAFEIQEKTIVLLERVGGASVVAAPPPPPGEIRGRVVDSAGNALVGVNVVVKGTKRGTTTDERGEFLLKGLEGDVVLVVSSVGYETFTVKAIGVEVRVVLRPGVRSMQDVVVNKGYYSTTQRLNTGDVTRVSGEEIAKQPVSDPILALEGRVPGLSISQTSGLPGAAETIRLRGQNSIANGNNPLFIVDGVPIVANTLTTSDYSLGIASLSAGLSPFNNLNPSDIESIEILKDADATAIYGSRGANGVVLVTTRKGKAGKTRFDINLNSGSGMASHFMPMLNTREYLAMRREAFANDGKTPGASDLDLNGTWDSTKYTDWEKVFIGNTAHYNNFQGSFSGGSNGTQYLVNGGYSNQTTVFPGDYSDRKASVSYNINHTSTNKRFRALFSGTYLKDDNKLPSTDLTSYLSLAPNAPANLVDAFGNVNWTNIPFNNPYALIKRSVESVTSNLIGNANLAYELVAGLQIKTAVGYTHALMDQVSLTPGVSWRPPNSTNPNFRRNSFGSNEVETWIIEPQVSYTKKIMLGDLEVLIGTSFQENKQTVVSQMASGFSSDDLVNNIKLATTINMNAYDNIQYRYNALYGRLNYSWKEKYLINLTARRDGSSRFGPGRQFGNFGALGVGWIFSNEGFIAKHAPFISFGKLRASYGTTGNDQMPDYRYLTLYQGYTTSNYQNAVGLYPTQISNPYYGWETVKKMEGGVELGFFRDRLFLAASYYSNRTNNQLVGYALPTTTGFPSIYANLPAVVQNTGIELVVNTVNILSKNVKWTSSVNLTIPRNKLVSYPGLATSAYATQYKEGRSLFVQYGYHVTGVDPQSGVYSIEDIDKSGSITSNDRQFIKEVAQEYYGGFQNRLSINRVELEFLFQFVKQTGRNYLGDNGYAGIFNSGNGNQPTYVLDRWQRAGDIASVEKFSQASGAAQQAWANGVSAGDYRIADASFVRLKNAALSYQFSLKLLQKAHLESCRVFLQGQNLFTVTNYKGMDPETQGRILPPLRIISLGMRLSL